MVTFIYNLLIEKGGKASTILKQFVPDKKSVFSLTSTGDGTKHKCVQFSVTNGDGTKDINIQYSNFEILF